MTNCSRSFVAHKTDTHVAIQRRSHEQWNWVLRDVLRTSNYKSISRKKSSLLVMSMVDRDGNGVTSKHVLWLRFAAEANSEDEIYDSSCTSNGDRLARIPRWMIKTFLFLLLFSLLQQQLDIIEEIQINRMNARKKAKKRQQRDKISSQFSCSYIGLHYTNHIILFAVHLFFFSFLVQQTYIHRLYVHV